jgi:Site-specific recombinase XerD
MPKRRGNGEGSIRKRKDGRWEGRYTAGADPLTGKVLSRNVLGKTQTETLEKLKAAIKEAEKLDLQRAGQYTVAQWARLWFETYSKPHVRESTALYYENYIEQHIIPRIGEVKLNTLTPIQVQRFYNDVKSGGRIKRNEKITDLSLSNRTVRGLHMLLHNCLEQAVRERLISVNPTDNCRIPPKERKEMKVIPPEKIGDYLKAAKDHGVLAMFYLELSSGLRRGELLALLWSDLDVATRTISVTKTVHRYNGELKVLPPKTENSIRKIVIPQQAVDLLEEEHTRHPDNPYMFPSPVTGGMYDPDAIGRTHKKLLARAGLESSIRFHDLRHTFSTIMIQNGVDAKTLSGMLGHYSAAFTLDTYTHITSQMQEAAAEKMSVFMESITL